MLLSTGYQIAIFLSKLWKVEQKITTLAASGMMHCKLMENKDTILWSIWHSYNQCVLGAKIWSSQRDQFWAPTDRDGFQIWLVELTGTNSLMWICILAAMVRFQLAEGHCELSLKAQLKGNCRKRIILAMRFGATRILRLLQCAHADQRRSLTLASPPWGQTLKLQNSNDQKKLFRTALKTPSCSS